MVGPVSLDVGRLKRLQNIHFLGRKPFDILPGYLAWSDIAINPYKIGDVAANCSPLKLYEYLAAGLPIVSTTMAEASAFPGLIRTADTCDEFLQHIETILKWSNRRREAHMARSRKESQNHTWEKRFLEVERIVMEIMR
jgi:glycosyltransferase involved in cell wall biosynthesis